MAKPRIPTKAIEMRDVLLQASSAIATLGSWPVTAPTQAEVATAAMDIGTILTQLEAAEAQVKALRDQLAGKVAIGRKIMQGVDYATDGMYGPQSGQKAAYGLSPKKPTHGEIVPLKKIVLRKVEDGAEIASIFLDWEPVPGAAAYEVDWFSDAAMTQRVDGKAVSKSEITVTGLQGGHQYWLRVRAVRGDEGGPWSDPATRVAGI